MKTKTVRILVWTAVVLVFACIPLLLAQPSATVPPLVSTNGAALGTNAPTALPPGLDQIADLLPAQAKAFLARVTIWIGSLSLIIAPFAQRLGGWLRDKLNNIAAGKAGGTDAWLAKLFSNPIYKFVSTLLLFINISLPTTAELDRAIKLQQEAVAESKAASLPPIT